MEKLSDWYFDLPTNLTTPLNYFTWMNDITIGVIWSIIAIALWAVLLIVMSKLTNVEKPFIAASFASMLASALMWALTLVSYLVPLSFFLLLMIGFFAAKDN